MATVNRDRLEDMVNKIDGKMGDALGAGLFDVVATLVLARVLAAGALYIGDLMARLVEELRGRS